MRIAFKKGELYDYDSFKMKILDEFYPLFDDNKYFSLFNPQCRKCIKSFTIEITTKLIEDEES